MNSKLIQPWAQMKSQPLQKHLLIVFIKMFFVRKRSCLLSLGKVKELLHHTSRVTLSKHSFLMIRWRELQTKLLIERRHFHCSHLSPVLLKWIYRASAWKFLNLTEILHSMTKNHFVFVPYWWNQIWRILPLLFLLNSISWTTSTIFLTRMSTNNTQHFLSLFLKRIKAFLNKTCKINYEKESMLVLWP